ncbi:MAG TPA: isoleucine--tRNA ligase [Candidatus Saccharimonadales bacterium]|nr:isoleucine--tRNA ligase [Candidatus Saccharimonadales bacterium]
MKFKKNTRRPALEYEKDLINYWRANKTFEKSVEMRPAADSYVFYDGPPFITGVPHHGTLLSSIVKDAVPRYQTMKGKRVERVWGWDCHGLPAEVFTEKKLGIHDKRDIGTKISLEDYIKTCRENMVATGDLWEETIARIGRWVDFKGAYKTMDKPYMESVWWAFKKLYEAGKIYEGEKVLLYCTRDATPISKAEVAMDNSYQDVTDPSVYVKFKLTDSDAYMLAWTTTPWTLPANTAVGVGSKETYAEVKLADGTRLVLLKELLPKVLTDEKHQALDYEVLRTFKGSELVGQEYEPLFEHRGEKAHRVWDYPGLSTEEGSGIVHLAPAYGEEDYELAREKGFPLVNNIDDNGFYTSGDWKGQYVWDANKPIAKELHEQGKVWKIDYIRHSYPHCHRCGTKLMYRAHPSWFMDINEQRQEMLEQNGNVHWFPEHIKKGRFAKTVESAPDWNLSRDRFWATAMPVWKGVDKDGVEHIKVVGSYAELKELSGVELEDYHRPWIDEVTFEIDGIEYKRIDKVLDCWFESGSMPFAQFHYPFENVEKFEQNFPGDFIAEYVGQVRAWFYYLHAVNVGLFGKNAFKNVIVTGTLAGSDGRKMSKSFGNYTDPNELMDQYSADALRFLLLSSPVLNGEDFSLVDKDVSDVYRKLSMVWNMFDFFSLYADVDGWEWDGKLEDPYQELANPLDQWVVSRVHQLSAEIEEHMDRYDIPSAMAGILPFIDDASNWYIRRSRKRFWKSDNDSDKEMAYRTLHYVLVRLSLLLAPFTPFLAEELYRNLTGGESVHLCDWPPEGQTNGLVLKEMAEVREVITQGLAQRAGAGIKVRQPLSEVKVSGMDDLRPELTDIITDELNVKKVSLTKGGELGIEMNLELNDELKREGLARELIRHIQSARKEAGLNVDDRIRLSVTTSDGQIKQAFSEHRANIFAETLTVHELTADGDFTKEIEVEGMPAKISLSKAAASD